MDREPAPGEGEASLSDAASQADTVAPDGDSDAASFTEPGDPVEQLVATWCAADRDGGDTPDVLMRVRQDSDAFTFTRRLLESLAGADDAFAAAIGFREASHHLPAALPMRDRLAVRAGGLASLGLPWAVLPIARRWMRERLSHLVLAARTPGEVSRDSQLSELRSALDAQRAQGFGTVLQPIGELVLGPAAVDTELRRLIGLTREAAVTHIAVDPERIAPGSDWSIDADADHAARLLQPLFEAARDTGTVIIFVLSSFRAARIAPEILTRGLANGDFGSVRAGVMLSHELPESHDMLGRLIRWSAQRVAGGGAPLELIIGAATITAGERIASVRSGLPVPTLDGRAAQSAQWLRLTELLLDAAAVSTGLPQMLPVVASEDPHLLAAALEMARERQLADQLVLQLRSGTAPELAQQLRVTGAQVRLLLPLTTRRDFAGAVDVLLALASEAAEPNSALGAVQDFAAFATVLEDERQNYRQARALAAEAFPVSHRVQSRAREWNPSERDSALFYRQPSDTERYDTGGLTAAVLGLHRGADGEVQFESQGTGLRIPHVSPSGFAHEPETDAAVEGNRVWLRGLLERAAAQRVANAEIAQVETAQAEIAQAATAQVEQTSEVDLDALVSGALAVSHLWGAISAKDRATRLRRFALGAAAARDRLIVELAAESGAPVPLLDAEVNGAIDAARYLADLAAGLGVRRGAEFRPDPLALVVIESGVPLEERAEALLALLAAGSAVIALVEAETLASTLALVEEWQVAGLPEGLVAIHQWNDDLVSLAADPRVSRALVLGSRERARSLIRRRPDLHIDGRFRERGTVIITPTANHSLAARDAVKSAFSVGMADARAARVIILVGSAARSRRLREQLRDAVRAIQVGDSAGNSETDRLSLTLGPLAHAPSEAGLRALTELDAGEEWLVQPEQLDETGRLWRPGVRAGLRRSARFWSDSAGMPVIGVVSARSMTEALQMQRELGGGGVAALHTGAAVELTPWLEGTAAASLVVNRATVPGAVETLPGGGWGQAGMGVETLAGGPNRLVTLGMWKLRAGSRSSTLHLRGLDPEVQLLIESAQSMLDYESFDQVRRAALSDALTWRTTLGRLQDEIGLTIERNLLRYWPTAVQIRLAESGALAGLVRVLAAAMLVRAPVTVSTGIVLPHAITEVLAAQGITVSLERDQDWLERIAIETRPVATSSGEATRANVASQDSAEPHRVRLIGGDAVRTAEWLGGQDRVAVWADPVTMAGPVELLAFLREQSISVSTNRYGLILSPPGLDEWIAELDARSAPPA